MGRFMDKINMFTNINSNLVSNIVPEPNNRREPNNNQQRPQEMREVIVDINKTEINNNENLKQMATTYEKIGDTYEKISRPQSAITAYQTSYNYNPNPEVVQKVDELAARISSEGKI